MWVVGTYTLYFKLKPLNSMLMACFSSPAPGTIDLTRIKTSTYVQCRRPPKGGFFVPENPFPNILPNMIFALVLDMHYFGFIILTTNHRSFTAGIISPG